MSTISKHSNFLPHSFHYELLRTFQSWDFPWYYMKDATYPDDPGNPDSLEEYKKSRNTKPSDLLEKSGARTTFGMAHTFFRRGLQSPSSYWNLVRPMIYFIEDTLGIKCMDKIIRCKINLLFNTATDDNTFNTPHVDHPEVENYTNILYYLNESDGDTTFFNEHFNGYHPEKVTVKETVSPVENGLVIFDGSQYHASSNPINFQDRITISWTIKN
jgi:hypothetical protein